MRRTAWMMAGVLFALAGCTGPTSPYGGGSQGGGGANGDVAVGNIFYRSTHNGTANPAVDTIAAGGSIKWIWVAAGAHQILSTGTPGIFRNGVVMSRANDSYTVTFPNPGTYSYVCGVHGTAMSGRIVVLP
jgi:plastocyanin